MAKKSRRSSTQAKRAANPRSENARSPRSQQVQKASSNPFEPMGRAMQAFMPFPWLNPWLTAMEATPKLDVIDRNGSVLVRAEVPGVQKDELEVEASDLAVTIKGEVRHEETREEDRYRIAEMRHGVFERTVRLPSEVDSAQAKATFKDGVLEVMLPKLDRSRPHPVKL